MFLFAPHLTSPQLIHCIGQLTYSTQLIRHSNEPLTYVPLLALIKSSHLFGLRCPSFALGSHIKVYEQTNASSPLIESTPGGKRKIASRAETTRLHHQYCCVQYQHNLSDFTARLQPTTAACVASRRRDLATPNGSQNTPEPIDVFVSPPLASDTMPSVDQTTNLSRLPSLDNRIPCVLATAVPF